MTEERPVAWAQAVQRAEEIAALGHHPADSWDGRAIRGVLAVTLSSLARRQERPVEEVDIGSVLWHLAQGPAMVYELGGELELDAERAQPEDAAAEWGWLTRPWPKEPSLANSDGMPRGIGRGSPLPAVDVVTHWAGSLAQAALVAERPAGLAPRTRVQVIGGEDEGRNGEVVAPAWLMDDENRTVMPGPPPGYEVVFTIPGQVGARRAVMSTVEGEIRIEAPGPHGEHVIIRAEDLKPEEPVPALSDRRPRTRRVGQVHDALARQEGCPRSCCRAPSTGHQAGRRDGEARCAAHGFSGRRCPRRSGRSFGPGPTAAGHLDGEPGRRASTAPARSPLGLRCRG